MLQIIIIECKERMVLIFIFAILPHQHCDGTVCSTFLCETLSHSIGILNDRLESKGIK